MDKQPNSQGKQSNMQAGRTCMEQCETSLGKWILKRSDRICNAGSLTLEATTFSDHALYNMFFSPPASRRKKASISHECYTGPNLVTSPVRKRRKSVTGHDCKFEMFCVQASSRGSEQVPISSLPIDLSTGERLSGIGGYWNSSHHWMTRNSSHHWMTRSFEVRTLHRSQQ